VQGSSEKVVVFFNFFVDCDSQTGRQCFGVKAVIFWWSGVSRLGLLEAMHFGASYSCFQGLLAFKFNK